MREHHIVTLSEESKSEKCSKSSNSHVGDGMLEDCCAGAFVAICCAFLLDGGGSGLVFSTSSETLDFRAIRIPVAKNLWWFAAKLPAEWIDSSQFWQNKALSSTQNMKAGFSYKYNLILENINKKL